MHKEAQQGEKGGGVKADGQKNRVDLLPYDALWDVAEVFTHGAQKYDDRNWEEGLEFHRLFGSLMRHMWAWWRGEDIDPDSGKNHLAHAGCNILMLLALVKRDNPELDTRPEHG